MREMAIRDDLRHVLPPDTVSEIPSGFQVIGNVAVISLPPSLHDYGGLVAHAILARHKNVRTVMNRIPSARNDLRIPETEVLAGDSTVTLCREYGFSYRLDVAGTFYTSRLASERRRVWMQVMPEERVLVPFAGVGPCAIPPAARGAHVTAVEKNPDSCRYVWENIRQNRVESQVTVHEGDLEQVLPSLSEGMDRAVIPAPYGYDRALHLVAPLVRQGGMIHFYTFKKASQIPALEREYLQKGLVAHTVRRCGYVAPGIARYVFDLAKGED